MTIKRRSEAQKGHLLLCLSGKKSIAILGIRHKSSVKTKEYINKRSVKTYEHGACAARTRTSVNPTPIAAQPLVQRKSQVSTSIYSAGLFLKGFHLLLRRRLREEEYRQERDYYVGFCTISFCHVGVSGTWHCSRIQLKT